MESLNTCISELQEHTFAQGLELEDAHFWCAESRREHYRKNWQWKRKHFQIFRLESSGVASWRIVSTKNERKSWYDTEAHFTNTRVAREGELHEWFRRISRYRIELVEIFLTFAVNRQSFQVHNLCSAATEAANPYMEFVWNTGKRFWQSRNSSLYESKCHRFDSSEGKYKATCRERWRTTWDQCRCLQEGRQPWILLSQRRFHTILWL